MLLFTGRLLLSAECCSLYAPGKTTNEDSRDTVKNALARFCFYNTNRLDAMDEGTFLENYLISLETLPNDVRRDFELVITLT